MSNDMNNRYPRTVTKDGETFEITRMTPKDGPAIGAFVATLPPHDLLFLSRDVRHPKVIAAWAQAVADGRVHSLVVRDAASQVVGCTAIVTEDMTWSRHVGELRVLLCADQRGKGLGGTLVQECFALALSLGLEKLCVRMTTDQRAAIASFEGLGFRAEAVLRNHVRDSNGQAHDIAVLSHDVAEVQARMQAYGLADVVGAE
jgi:L-amino acid N-acyltransferase YncA